MPRTPRRQKWTDAACYNGFNRGHNREMIFADDEVASVLSFSAPTFARHYMDATEICHAPDHLLTCFVPCPSPKYDGLGLERIPAGDSSRMNTTSATLLESLRQPTAQDAWARFVYLYTPLVYYWAHRLGLTEADAADLVEDVFVVLVQKLPEFRYDRDRGFRNWLRTVMLNKWRNHSRRQHLAVATGYSADVEEVPSLEESDAFSEEAYRQHLVNRALQLMRAEFSPKTWKACWEHVVVGRPALEVAGELGISVGGVYVAKSRVLSRLRQELNGLLD